MFTETIELETLRQRIEDVEFEAGSQSDYLDRGKPNAAQIKHAREMIDQLNSQSKALPVELKERIAIVRLQQPQALEEWIKFHTDILEKIVGEDPTNASAAARCNVAKGTLQEWENVRLGKQEYVRINWYFLKDYRASVRKIGSTLNGSNPASKVWWQFWK